MQNGRRATDANSSAALHNTGGHIILLTFTTAKDVAPCGTAFARSANGTASDGNGSVAIHARFLSTTINTLCNGHYLTISKSGVTIDSKSHTT